MLSTSELNLLNDREVIDYCLDNNFNFAMYRYPDASAGHLLISEEERLLESLPDTAGYIFAPFDNAEKWHFIPAQYSREISKSVLNTLPDLPEITFYPDNDYIDALTALIAHLKTNEGKTVFAYCFEKEVVDIDVLNLYFNLSALYPSLYIYLWYTAETKELWLGATPEILLSQDSEGVKTMALAGTRPVSSNDAPWDTKNVKEQSLVTEFITDCFAANGYTPHIQPTYTLNAGRIEHICTPISAAPLGQNSLASLLKSLSPTPAVCGSDFQFSMQYICGNENKPRRFYGGFSGFYSPDSDFTFYVTLRCACLNLMQKKACIYAGGWNHCRLSAGIGMARGVCEGIYYLWNNLKFNLLI